MPRFNKWLTNIAPGARVSRVGKQAIRVRLRAVLHFLQRVDEPEAQAEMIHQLRIWTRRSAAALRLFEEIVPRTGGKAMKKRLRKLRAAAGQVRDCDVLLERLREGESDPPRTIVKALKARRREARQGLCAMQKQLLRRHKLEREMEKLVGQLDWPKRHSSRKSPPFDAWCRAQLGPLGELFFSLAESDLAKDTELHELRIAGKRLRYALELAPAALPTRLHQRLYEALSDLQERLGTVCDHLAAAVRLQEWRADTKSRDDRQALKTAMEQEQQQLAIRRRQFLRWWSAARRERLRADWESAIGRAE